MTESATKSIARNFSWLAVGSIASGLAKFGSTVYIARVLGAASFGLYYFAQAFLSYLALLVDSGLSVLGTKEVAQNREDAGKIALNIFLIRFVIALVVYLISTVILFCLPLDGQMRLLFLFTFLFIFYRALNADWVFQGLEKMQYIAFARTIYALTMLGGVLWLVKGANDLVAVPFIQFATGIAACLLFMWILFKKETPLRQKFVEPKLWSTYFIQAIPLGASYMMILIYNNLDTIMLGFMSTAAIVGYYNAAYQIFFVLVGAFSLWQSTAIPVASRLIVSDRDKTEQFINKYFFLTMLVVVPAVILTAIMAPAIVKLVYGVGYLPAILALQVLVWTMLAMAIGSTYGVLVLIPAGKFNLFFWAVLAGAAVNVVFNILLIPPYNFVGAAIATILAEVTAGTIAFYLSRGILKISLGNALWRPVCYSVLSLIGAALPYSLLGMLGDTYRLFAAGIGFAIVYAALVVIFERDTMFGFVAEILRKRNPGDALELD